MCNLASVTVDAGVLAVPHVGCIKDDAFQYVENLLDWKQLLDMEWVDICMSEQASASLFADALFPLREHLTALFTAHGIIEYDVNTVARIATQLLEITPTFEDCHHVQDVLTEHLQTEPDILSLTPHVGLASDLARCITVIAVLRKYCSQPLGGHSLILRKAPTQMVKIKAHIHDIEHAREDLPVLPCPPEFFEGDILVCDNFSGLIECIDESAIMVGAADDYGIDLAVRIALFKYTIEQGESPDWDETIVPARGPRFRELCQQICIAQGEAVPRKILRAIVETVKGQNLSAVHSLRTGPGGNAPQIKRGSDKAQRRDIDKEFHLHYWECAGGAVELASVVYHNNFSIPE